MKKRWRSLRDAYWALDRFLGGQQRPTRSQRWVARHPVKAGLCLGVPFALFFWTVTPEEEPDGFLFAVLGGLLMSSCFGLFAFVERLRQRRLRRLGIWDGSGAGGDPYEVRKRSAPPGEERGAAGTDRRVSWTEALLVASVCWVVNCLGYAVLAALDEPGIAVAPLLCIGLAQWFWTRHRVWPAAVAAGLAGIAVLFGTLDLLRPDLGRYAGDALATGLAVTAALGAFALTCRVRTRAGGRNH
ncbi:hypothetical protein [Streptomyces sp. P9-A2]|uniref:hypothetical protein n=1 Tax=Streptomyces sp. P9-A2 TaxID=3072284 RepID=UPI002FC9CD07